MVEDYEAKNGSEQTSFRAVRASAPGYFVHYIDSDAQYLGTTVLESRVETLGSVACLVDDSSNHSECMRSSPALTVWIGPFEATPAAVAKLVNSTWKTMGGDPASGLSSYGSSPSTAPIKTSISLPSTLGEYVPLSEVSYAAQVLPEVEKGNAADTVALSSLFGGAAAAADQYSDQAAVNGFSLYAVRESSPVRWVPYFNAKQSGQLEPTEQQLSFGTVTCDVLNDPVNIGGKRADLHPRARWCMRSSAGLTVTIDKVYGDAFTGKPAEVAQLVNAAWASLAPTN